jgi:hypothetical protein
MIPALGETISHNKYGKGTVVVSTERCVGVQFSLSGRVNFKPSEFEHPVEKYLATDNGLQFISILRRFENTMYAKVRNSERFFSRYLSVTGESISPLIRGILISEQEDKWGDEMSIRFELGDFSPSFPVDANPRMYDGSKGILNDNQYIWTLIEKHGFRFGK